MVIETRFLGPTNSRGSRVVAQTLDNRPSTGKPDRLVVGWDHALNTYENHAKAAQTLAQQMGWEGEWHGGGTQQGYCWVREGLDGFVVPEREEV